MMPSVSVLINDLGILDKLRVIVLAENSVLPGTPFLGQHGISLYLEAHVANTWKHVLVDVGQNTDALLYNAKLMGIELSTIDAIILTHRHPDHTRGLSKLLKTIGKEEVPIIAHPDILKIGFVDKPFLRYTGLRYEDSKERVEESGGRFFLVRDPVRILPGLLTTGEIERVTDFEKPEGFKTITDDGRVVEDEIRDDISVIGVSRKGLVILTGCAHAGIVNIVKHAISMTRIRKVVAVVGGLHLISAPDENVTKTVRALKELGVEVVYAGHCTGFKAQVELYREFGENFKPLQTGMVIEF